MAPFPLLRKGSVQEAHLMYLKYHTHHLSGDEDEEVADKKPDVIKEEREDEAAANNDPLADLFPQFNRVQKTVSDLARLPAGVPTGTLAHARALLDSYFSLLVLCPSFSRISCC
jgi:hypothetical protein